MPKKKMPISPSRLPKSDSKYQKWLESLKMRPPPWNKGKTKDNDKRVKKMSNTFKNKEIDNFAEWRKNAKEIGLIPNTNIPFNKDENLAFLIGMILGDGHIQKISRTQLLSITLGTDKPELWRYVAKILEEVINKKPTIRYRKNSACLDLRIYQNNLSERLQLPIGKKTDVKLELHDWIWERDEYLIQALRGLYEADGSFSIHKPTYTYNLSLSNHNTSLLNEVEKALIYLGFNPERRQYYVRLRKKREVLKFEKLISFRSYN